MLWTPGDTVSILLSAELNAEELKQMGFDVSEFIDGTVKFVARPMPDSSIQMAVDVTDATVSIDDLGISKPAGVAGSLQAAVRQSGSVTELSQIDITFSDVKLQGSLGFDAEKGLLPADGIPAGRCCRLLLWERGFEGVTVVDIV